MGKRKVSDKTKSMRNQLRTKRPLIKIFVLTAFTLLLTKGGIAR